MREKRGSHGGIYCTSLLVVTVRGVLTVTVSCFCFLTGSESLTVNLTPSFLRCFVLLRIILFILQLEQFQLLVLLLGVVVIVHAVVTVKKP
jgi:hypothetical protein